MSNTTETSTGAQRAQFAFNGLYCRKCQKSTFIHRRCATCHQLVDLIPFHAVEVIDAADAPAPASPPNDPPPAATAADNAEVLPYVSLTLNL